MGLVSEEGGYGEGSGTSYERLCTTVVDEPSVEGLLASVVAIRVTLPISVVVVVSTESQSLILLQGLNLLENRPSDTLSAWGLREGSLVRPVGAGTHLFQESRNINVLGVPSISLLEFFSGLSVSFGLLEVERVNELVGHSSSRSTVKEDGNSGNFVLRSTSLLLEHKLELGIVSEAIDGVLGGGLNDSFPGVVLGVGTHRVNNIKLTGRDIHSNVGSSSSDLTYSDFLESLGTDGQGSVGGRKSGVEVDRRLLGTGLAGQGPVVSIELVGDHLVAEGVLG